MLMKLGMLAAIPFILMGAVLITTDTVIVDVREGGPDGNHIVVPIPLPLAQAVLHLVPAEETTITCDELWRYRDAISRVVDELRRAPDGELIRVQERNELVLITKRGSNLHVTVEGHEENIELKVPLAAAQRFLARMDGATFSASDLLASVNHTMHGRVVHVKDRDTEVKISVW